MRKVERLDGFYEGLKSVHKKSFPDLRFGQFMNNFFNWVQTTKKRDVFFYEEDEMLNLIIEYANAHSI